MYTENFEQWFKINKNLASPLNDLNKATTEMYRRISQESLEMIGENASRFSEQVKRLGSVKKPEDVLTLTRDCLTEDFNAGIANVQTLMQLSLQSMEEFAKLSGNLREQTTNTNTKSQEKEKYK